MTSNHSTPTTGASSQGAARTDARAAGPDATLVASHADTQRPRAGRLLGLDAVRALAILGMVYMHVSPTGWLAAAPFAERPATMTWLESIFTGRSMSIFVLLAGISVALMTGGSTAPTGERLRAARLRLALRAGVLFLISLVVDQLTGASLSILAYYALWMLLLIPLLRLSPRALLAAAGVLGVVLPVFCYVLLNYGMGWAISPMSMTSQPAVGLALLVRPQDWPGMLHQLLLGGGFQTPYALPLLLAGLAIGRLDLRSRAVRRRLAVWGGALIAVNWLVSRLALGPLGVERAMAELFAGSGPFLQPLASVLTLPPTQLYALSIPMAPFMAGVGLLLLTGLLTVLELPFWRSALAPLTAAGRLALTWYAAHLVFIERVASEPPYAFTLFAGMLVFALVASPLWLRFASRGPLEWLMHRATKVAAPVPASGGAATRTAA